MAKKTYIVIPILKTTSGGGAEKDNCSAETEKIGAENAKIESAEKSAGGCFYTNANAFFLGCTKLG